MFIQHQSASLTVLIFQRLSSQPFCGLPRCTVTPAGRARACGAPTIVRIRDRRHSWRGGNQTKKLRIPLASSSGYGTQRKSKFEEPQWLQTFAASIKESQRLLTVFDSWHHATVKRVLNALPVILIYVPVCAFCLRGRQPSKGRVCAGFVKA